jgi:hypothetical protein
MARKPKPKVEEASELMQALSFLSHLVRKDGEVYEQHCQIFENQAVMFNGYLGAGYQISEDWNAAPDCQTLLNALSKCGESFSITLVDSGRLSVKAGKFRAMVPCVPLDVLPTVRPDPPQGALSEPFRQAIAAVLPVLKDDGESDVTTSVLIGDGSVTATDRALMIEVWHGISMPPGLVLPKPFCTLLTKIKTPLSSFGFSSNSFTVWFEDRSWLRTQLRPFAYPNVAHIWNQSFNPWPLPSGFWDAIDAVEPFSDDGWIRFGNEQMQSHADSAKGAKYEIVGIPSGVTYSARLLKIAKPFAKTFDLVGKNGVSFFAGDNVRGILCQIVNNGA